ncbi:M23 family metallopeptidase [Prevotella sp.]|uniref:M23 family metallopeptidase n=1 Tax=Prevotella sp. TaxID=59823 RepID=UPI002F9415C0
MTLKLRLLLSGLFFVVTMSAFAPVRDHFTAAEQQQISIETPGLFARSNAFHIDFSILKDKEYSFPLPVGKAKLMNNNAQLEITTKQGDVVKAMFGGVVRLSRKLDTFGNVVIIRHDNGLETVYGDNAQNLVKVGQRVKAGQSIAIVGQQGKLTFAIMVNGGRINPETIIAINSHKLRKQTILCKKVRGSFVDVSVVEKSKSDDEPDITDESLAKSSLEKLNLSELEKERWAYPLPGSHVISPYGGKRHHAGVDLKTKPNDKIVAAFDGIVTLSGRHYGYGNCIKIKHKYGFETLYSHQSKNFVKVGQKVKAGEVIGLTGRTGRATTEHLHFEISYKGRRMNPAVVFDHANRKLQQVTLTLGKNGKLTSKKNK